MYQIASDVLRRFQTAGVKAVRMDLKAMMVDLGLSDDTLQGGILRVALPQALAKQVTPFGGETPTWHLRDLHPGPVFQAALCHHQMHVRFEAKVAAEGAGCVDHAHPHARVEIGQHGLNRLRRHLEQVIQECPVGMEEGSQCVVSGQGKMQVRHFEQIGGDGIDPFIDSDLAATRTESRLTREGHSQIETATRAFVTSVTRLGVAAKHHALYCLAHVSLLVRWDFIFQPQITPVVKVVAENLAKQIGARWAIRAEG